MSSTKSQVAIATNIPNLSSSSQSQKDYNNSSDEPLGRQNSFGNNRRGNMKGKHLTRSHAMRESTSPPRTPTPRAEHAQQQQQQVSPNGPAPNYQQHVDGNENANNNNNSINNNNNKLHAQSSTTRGNSPIIEAPAVIVTSQQQQQQQQQQQPNVALSNEAEFPKLTPPKSTKGGGGSSGGGGGGGVAGGGQRNNNSSSSNSSNNSNASNSNGAVDGSNNKIEYNGNGNNGKKVVTVDLKSSSASSGGGGGVCSGSGQHDTHKSSNNNNNSKNQQYNAGNALHQALNVSDSGGVGSGGGIVVRNNSQQQQQSNTTATTIHNSGMNYQLNSIDQQQQQHQHQHHHHQQQIAYDKENRCPRNDSQNSNISNMHDDEQCQQQQHQQQHYGERGIGGSGGKKHRTNSNSKGTKPRLKNMGSSSGSVDGGGGGGRDGGVGGGGSTSSSNNTSGFISRVFNNSENSNDQFTDHGGTDLLSFFKETLNKNLKDRHILLKIEKELIELVQDKSRSEMRFPSASSYNRMLIHRTAAFFGMEHNVDTETQQCVIVGATKNTRIPEIRFKSLVRDHREDSRKSILKRDSHSFDEARQRGYLCPDRGGMLDRKAKSFEEREEDYERARSRIFNRSQNDGGECMDENYMNISWTTSVEQQQQQQQQQHNRQRPNGKMLKMQNSTESRDGRSAGAVPKAHSFGGYGGPPPSGGPALLRGDSANSNKSGGQRVYSKQDSAGSANTPWRLSPSSSGSIYHFDPSNLPPSQAMASGVYHSNSSTSNNSNSSNYIPQQQQQQQQPTMNLKKNKVHQIPQPSLQQQQQQQPQHHQSKSPMQNDASVSPGNSMSDTISESSTQTMSSSMMNSEIAIECSKAAKTSMSNRDNNGAATSDANTTEEASTQIDADECDNATAAASPVAVGGAGIPGCLSITTTTSTKNYDRIEVQKFKNQATSPNIPIEKEEQLPKRENSASSDASNPRDLPSRNQQPTSQTPTSVAVAMVQQQQHRETPLSARSTPFSNSETHTTKRASEEPKATTWTYTQSYQAADGSTVFHTTTPNSQPYCATTYQQGPDGSVYAIPQGMVYAYPPPESEVQSYFMPVFDATQQRTDATGLIPAGAQAIYPTAGGTTTMVPVAAAYPTTQFATASGTPIYPGQVIYSSDQFAPSGAAPAPANGQLQQIPMTTYPIGYPYPYNAGYWGQTMTYYVPQQALANAVTATPLLQPPPPPPPQSQPTAAVAGPHVASGATVNLSNGLITATAAAGPPSNATMATLSGGSNNIGGGGSHVTVSGGGMSLGGGTPTSSYQTHGGTTYYGTGRIKRPTPPHYGGAPPGSHQLMATIPNSGNATTTYQLGHAAVPTLTLAAAPTGAGAGTNDLSGVAAAASTTTMYALPQHPALFPANVFPYATAATAAASAGLPTATAAASAPQAHTQGAVTLAPPAATHATTIAHAPQTNAVITPFYAHHPQMHAHCAAAAAATMHAPGPAAIPIVDPATLTQVPSGVNGTVVTYGGSNASQSAPSTPHSLPSHAPQRNPPLFSTPPVMNMTGGGVNYSSNNSTPHYYTTTGAEQIGAVTGVNNPHNSYAPSSHDKRNHNASSGGKKPSTYVSGGGSISRQNSNNNSYNGGGSGKPSLLGSNNDTRSSPNSGGSNGYHHGTRSHPLGKRDKPQAPLLSGPPPPTYSSNMNSSASGGYHSHSHQSMADSGGAASISKPPIRLNAAAASFRQKSSGIEFRRSVSQRNSPSTNSSSNENSNNTSPNGIGVTNSGTPIAATNCYAAGPTYVTSNSHNISNSGGAGVGGIEHQVATAAAPTTSLYIAARGSHIPPQLQHGSVVTAGGAAAAAAAAMSGATQPTTTTLLGTYNPGATGVYFKYGQTYFAHPSVALPNSRRSPSTELRPQMAQMTGMYPTVNMMISAPPRHAQGRHPNPNYKGTRPR